MDFDRTEEQTLLANTLQRHVREHYTFAQRSAIASSEAGWSKEAWRVFADLGAIGALFNEAAGGYGGGGFDIDTVFSAIGAGLVVEPVLGALMAGRVLAQCGRTGLVGETIAGRTVLALAHDEPESGYELEHVATCARRAGASWALTGAKAVIPQLAAADHIVVSAKADGTPALFLIDKNAPGLSVRDYALIDGGRGGDLALADTPAQLLTDNGAALLESARAAGVVALCSEAVAIMERLSADTLDYLRTRKQFGAPIGQFQALRHRAAALAMEIEQARSAAILAAARLDGERYERERAVSAAKFTIGRVGARVVEECLQMHGGIGLTWELPLSHYAKRLTMIGHQLGDEDHHLQRYMRLARG